MRLGSWGIALLAPPLALACSSATPLAPEAPAAPGQPAPSPGPVDEPAPVVPGPYRAIALAVGDVDVCVILDDHKAKCWGLNGYGQLGTGDATPRGRTPQEMGDALPTVALGAGRTARQISLGHYGMCALLDDGEAKCWGALVGIPPAAQGSQDRTGDALQALPVPAGRRIASITAGYNFPLGILDDGTGLVWSDGQSKVVDFHTPSRLKQAGHGSHRTFVLFEDGTSTLLSDPKVEPPAPSLPLGSPSLWMTGQAQADGLCALLADGRAACESRGSFPVAAADTAALAVGLAAPRCVLLNDGVVRCFGTPGLGCEANDPALTYWCDSQVPAKDGMVEVKLPQPATAIGAGNWSTCALLTDGSVWCWGSDASQGEQESFRPWLGGSVAVTTDADGRPVYAGWHAVDLGTRR
jgi:hypothetical protein